MGYNVAQELIAGHLVEGQMEAGTAFKNADDHLFLRSAC